MLDFFQNLHTRTKVVVLVVVMFAIIMAIALPILFIRNHLLKSKGFKCFNEGDFAGAFDPLRKLLKFYIGMPGYGVQPNETEAEKIIAAMTQMLNNTSAAYAFQQIVSIHRQIIGLKSKKNTGEKKEQIRQKIDALEENGKKLLEALPSPFVSQPFQPGAAAAAHHSSPPNAFDQGQGLSPQSQTGTPQPIPTQPVPPQQSHPQHSQTHQPATEQKIRFQCPCGKVLTGPKNLSGKTVKCPACQQSLQLP